MEHISKAQIKLIRSLQQKKFRDESALFVAEGSKCVEELSKGFELEYLVMEEELSTAESVSLQRKAKHPVTAKRNEIEQMSSLRTPQGVIGVFKKQRNGVPRNEEQRSHIILVLDGIQDPGNLGTIIRTCDWFGVHTIFCSMETADCYNPKVVQATMGSLARVDLHYTNLTKWLEGLSSVDQHPALIYGTLLEGENMYETLALHRPNNDMNTVIIMGNEGNGISPEVRRFIDSPIRIPTYPADAEEAPESLNVAIATAVVLSEFRNPAHQDNRHH